MFKDTELKYKWGLYYWKKKILQKFELIYTDLTMQNPMIIWN